MRVVNDREEKAQQQPDLGFFGVASYALLTAVGIATVLFGPLPMILGHVRLADPWPKVAAVMGAVIALAFLDIPMPAVLMTFIFGLFVADGVWKELDLWKLIRDAGLVALAMGAFALLVASQLEKTDLLHYWSSLVDLWMGQLEKTMHVEKSVQWEAMRGIFLYEGPFLYLSGVILSLWFSVGIAAHMGWTSENHSYSGEGLRKARLPVWVSLGFVALFAGAFFGTNHQVQHVFGGIFRLAGSVMFVQGCICLSELLSRRPLRPRVRTIIYSVAIVLGFYALMGIGVMSPWILKKKKELEEVK